MNYEIGKVYTFRVKKKFYSQTELIDDATGQTTYLHNTERLNLPKEIKCRVVKLARNRPIVEIVGIDDYKFTSGLTAEKLKTILNESDIQWDTDDFVEMLLAEDNEESFESQCYSWLDKMRRKYDLPILERDCSDLLELSGLLDQCGPAQREYYQERLTVLIEIISYYITASQKIADGTTDEFIEHLFKKLRVSGFVYHPDKNFSILAAICILKPAIMSNCIAGLLEIIRQRDMSTWKKEPFNTALTRLLEMYIRVSIYSIDREKEPRKSEIVKNCINALAVQLSLCSDHDSTVIDPRLTTARLCTVSTYVNGSEAHRLLDNGFAYLFNDDVLQLNFSTIDIEKLPYIMANSQPGGIFDSNAAFAVGDAKISVDRRGISLANTITSADPEPVLPSTLSLWKDLQVFLDQRIDVSFTTANSKDLKTYEDAWTEVESHLFSHNAIQQPEQPKHRTGDAVTIRFVRQDPFNTSKFYCKIVDETGGEGYIYVKPDIVPYTVYNPQLTSFLGRTYNADIIECDNDGKFHFSMCNDIKSVVAQEFQYGDIIFCWLGWTPNRGNRLAPAVSKEGASVTLKVPEELMDSGLRQGSIVKARVLGDTPSDDSSHLFAEVIEIDPTAEIIVPEAFHSLLDAVGFESDIEFEDDNDSDTDDPEVDRELDDDYVRQIILFIDRLAMIDSDYIKSYNYLWFCYIMCRMIGRNDLATYYNGRKGIISMLHYFAKNNSLDEEALSRFEINNSDLLSNNSPLRERFLQLQAVSYISKPGHDDDLAEMARKNPNLRPLARLVLAYNIVKEAGMKQNADDIHNKIKQILNLKGFDTNLKYYGTEGTMTEFKTSIVTPAGEKYPNYDRQMNEILSVINSFLNTHGGTLYVGVNDAGMGIGIEADLSTHIFSHDHDRYRRAITDAVAMRWGNYVATFINTQFDAQNPRKDVLVVNVKPHPDGVEMPDGQFLVRIDSSKRHLTPEEFRLYQRRNRNWDADQDAASDTNDLFDVFGTADQIDEDDFHPQKAIVRDEAAADNHSAVTSDRIATSRIRKNIFEDWNEHYVTPIALVKFNGLDSFTKIEEFDYDYDTSLTLTILDEEQKAFLIMGYENGHVVRVPVEEILKFDNSPRKRFADAKLIFASIAAEDDFVLSIFEENKNSSRIVMRADRVDSFEEGNLQDIGSTPCNDQFIGNVLAYDIIPRNMADKFEGIIGLDRTRSGHTANERTQPMVDLLHELGITEI